LAIKESVFILILIDETRRGLRPFVVPSSLEEFPLQTSTSFTACGIGLWSRITHHTRNTVLSFGEELKPEDEDIADFRDLNTTSLVTYLDNST